MRFERRSIPAGDSVFGRFLTGDSRPRSNAGSRNAGGQPSCATIAISAPIAAPSIAGPAATTKPCTAADGKPTASPPSLAIAALRVRSSSAPRDAPAPATTPTKPPVSVAADTTSRDRAISPRLRNSRMRLGVAL